jgi:hypothetical protein
MRKVRLPGACSWREFSPAPRLQHLNDFFVDVDGVHCSAKRKGASRAVLAACMLLLREPGGVGSSSNAKRCSLQCCYWRPLLGMGRRVSWTTRLFVKANRALYGLRNQNPAGGLCTRVVCRLLCSKTQGAIAGFGVGKVKREGRWLSKRCRSGDGR